MTLDNWRGVHRGGWDPIEIFKFVYLKYIGIEVSNKALDLYNKKSANLSRKFSVLRVNINLSSPSKQ